MDLKQYLMEPEHLPTMPQVVLKALSIIKNENAAIAELSKSVSCDESMSAKILKLVNSAHYSLPQKIISVNKAIALIGLNQTKNIIVSIAMKSILSQDGDEEIWDHSIRCAVCCENLAREFKILNPDEAFIIGFMHDIGKMVLKKQDADMYSKVLDLVRRGMSYIDAEDMYFKINHAEVGFYIANQWGFSEVTANAIRFHHSPLDSKIENIAAMVYYANELSKETIEEPFFDPEIVRVTKIYIKDYLSYKKMISEKTDNLLSALSVI